MERLMEIRDKILAWWNKFTSKQKTIIIAIGAVVVFTFAILFYVVSRPTYVTVKVCEDTAEASEVVETLESAGIASESSKDGLTIQVEDKYEVDAIYALGAAGFSTTDPTLADYMGSGFSTTESDKQRMYVTFLEDSLEASFRRLKNVKDVVVRIDVEKQDGTLIASNKDASAYIQLELAGTFTADNAAAMARATASRLGNESTAGIVIMDQNANLLYSGEDDYTTAGQASTFLELNNQAESYIKYKVTNALLMTGQFDMVEVAPYLNFDYSTYEQTDHKYSAQEGREEGLKAHETVITEEGSSGSGGVPGTTSNDETGPTYMYQDGNESSSSYESRDTDYLPDESILNKLTPAGVIDYNNSAITVAAIQYNEVHEELVESQGLLDGITWEEYKLTNNTSTKIEVDEDFYSAVATATGMDVSNITIVAYRENLFYDKETADINWNDVLSITMIVIILGVLAFVILHSMGQKQEVEVEEELSVESLLQSTQESDVGDIEVETKSETRKMIEKFVDENPESAANLLRNWLNEDWG